MNKSTQLLTRLCRQTIQNSKNFSRTPRSMEELGGKHNPSHLDKKMLVWTKMYKSIEEVPDAVSSGTMKKTRDLMRIRLNIGMAVATVIGCIVVISYSRSKQGQGDSLQNRGLQWEADMREKGRQERQSDHSEKSS